LAATFITTFKSVFSHEGREADAKPPQFPTEVRLIQSVIVDKDGTLFSRLMEIETTSKKSADGHVDLQHCSSRFCHHVSVLAILVTD